MPNSSAVQSDRKAQVEAAIALIKEFHTIGQQSLKKRSERGTRGKGEMEKEAREVKLNPDTLRKARQFAKTKSGYTKTDVQKLCTHIRKVQSTQDSSQGVFGRTHLIRLLTVPKDQREKLQQKAIDEGWSVSKLEGEIATRFGTRRQGGRKQKDPGDVSGVLTKLESLCEQWLRFLNQISTSTEQRRKPMLERLSSEVQDGIDSVRDRMESLQDLVDRDLGKLHKQREGRAKKRKGEEKQESVDSL